MTAAVGFALVAALHAGFQVTVTTLVYPALARQPSEAWAAAHAAHSRAIAPLVGVLYAVLVAAGAWLLVTGPQPLGWAALALTAVALAVTATVAAPLHGRLTERDGALVARLLVVDRWRCLAAVLGAVAAAVAVR